MVTFGETALASPTISFDKVQLPNGVHMHFAQQGPRTGPALVLLHGYSDSWASFSRVLPLFRPDLRVLVPDLRGHGDSSRPPLAEGSAGQSGDGETETGQPATGYRIVDFAEDVVQLMNGLRIPKAVVLGHSMGGFVARRIAAFVEERVPRLILMHGLSAGAGPLHGCRDCEQPPHAGVCLEGGARRPHRRCRAGGEVVLSHTGPRRAPGPDLPAHRANRAGAPVPAQRAGTGGRCWSCLALGGPGQVHDRAVAFRRVRFVSFLRTVK